MNQPVCKSMNKILIFLVFSLSFSYMLAHAEQYNIEKVTDSQYVWDNQTITNVFVTISENNVESEINDEHHYGEIMTSSAAILGFIGFASIINVANFTKEINEKIVALWILYGSIALMISLHLTLIIFAYFENLNDGYFLFVMIATIIVVITIIGITGFLAYGKSTYSKRRHQTKNLIDIAMQEFISKQTDKIKQSIDDSALGNPLNSFDKK